MSDESSMNSKWVPLKTPRTPVILLVVVIALGFGGLIGTGFAPFSEWAQGEWQLNKFTVVSILVAFCLLLVVGVFYFSAWRALTREVTKHKQAADGLRRIKDRLAAIISEAPTVAIEGYDIDGKVLYWNKAAERLFGFAAREALGKTRSQLVLDKEAGGTFLEILRHVDKADNPYGPFEWELKHREGFTRAVYSTIFPIPLSGDNKEFICMDVDVSERKDAEEALRKSRDDMDRMQLQHQAVLRSTPNGLCMVRADWTIQWANRAMSKILEPSASPTAGHLQGIPLRALFFTERDYKRYIASASQVIKITGTDLHELYLRRLDGTPFWCEISLVRLDPSEIAAGYVATVNDISERKLTEEALRRVHRVYREAIENAQGVPYRADYIQGRYEYVGAGCEELLGIPVNQLTFNKMKELVKEVVVTDPEAPSDPHECSRAFHRGDLERYRADYRIMTPQGQEKWVSNCSLPIRDGKTGRVIGSLGIFHDITERKRAEQELKQYSERLEEMVEQRTGELRDAQEKLVRREKLAILGQLAGGVGHELRNTLGVISNAVYFLKTVRPTDDDITKEYLQLIAAEVNNSEKIVSDLLDLSRTKPAEREEIAVQDLVEQVLEWQSPPANVKVNKVLANGLPPLFVDSRQLSQVLGNLVLNACQAMPEGGELTIDARELKDKIAISVTDTGSGISLKDMKKIFEPLFTTKARGVGLGLAVSKNLVEVNGGSILVESDEGKGSTFTVLLPTNDGAV